MNEEKGMVSQEAVAATSADTGSIMPLAADLSKTQDVTKVSEVSTINSTDQFYMNQSGKFVQVDYSKLADAILGKISSKTYSLDQGTKTLIAAINELNSKSKTAPYAIGERIETNTDLNDLVSPGVYTSIASNVSQTLKNAPYSNAGFRLEVKEITSDSGNSVLQIAYKSNDNVIHIRNQLNSVWKDWTQL